MAFSAYHVARDETLRYLATGGPDHPDIRLYYDALLAWESTLLNWAACLRIVKAMRQENLFQTGDGSSEARAYLLQNAAKHWGEGSDFSKDQTVPIWLADAGISSGTATLAYDELGDLIRDLAKLSNEVQDPVAFKQAARLRQVINDRAQVFAVNRTTATLLNWSRGGIRVGSRQRAMKY